MFSEHCLMELDVASIVASFIAVWRASVTTSESPGKDAHLIGWPFAGFWAAIVSPGQLGYRRGTDAAPCRGCHPFS